MRFMCVRIACRVRLTSAFWPELWKRAASWFPQTLTSSLYTRDAKSRAAIVRSNRAATATATITYDEKCDDKFDRLFQRYKGAREIFARQSPIV